MTRVAKDVLYNTMHPLITNLFKPGLTALALTSYSFYSLNKFNLSNVLNDRFFQMKCLNGPDCLIKIDGNHYNLNQIFT